MNYADEVLKINYADLVRTAKRVVLKEPGAYVVNGKLFFRLLDGSTLTCECIADPYATKIMELFEWKAGK